MRLLVAQHGAAQWLCVGTLASPWPPNCGMCLFKRFFFFIVGIFMGIAHHSTEAIEEHSAGTGPHWFRVVRRRTETPPGEQQGDINYSR